MELHQFDVDIVFLNNDFIEENYMKTLSFGIKYFATFDFFLQRLSSADFVKDIDNHKSCTNYVYTLIGSTEAYRFDMLRTHSLPGSICFALTCFQV
uniref:Uncharacterized protein n=1 Tax=Physcomitrium patens TaxID=3218 RepID=A0A2K1JYM7_PHYPA|nr:hypothetical protein PHYPA_013751 [Physcomitrium patens]